MSTPDLHTPQGWPAPSSGSAANPYAVPTAPSGSSSPFVPPHAAATAHDGVAQNTAVPYAVTPYALAQNAVTHDHQRAVAQYPQPGAASPSSGPVPVAPWQHAMPHPGQYPPFPAVAGSSGHRPSGLAVAALALGCVAIVVLGVQTGVASAVLAVVGLVLGIVGLVGARSRAGGRAGGRGLAVAGVTTSAVAGVLAGAVFVVTGTSVGEQLQAGMASFAGGTYDLPIVSLRPGEPATVGDYTVTVDDIQMDADAALAADPLNDPAVGRYVQAVVTVKYEGSGFGVPAEDLLVSYVGSSDDWTYDEWGCWAVTDRPVSEVGRLTPGETATFVSCMDVPLDAIDETAVIVEDLHAVELTAELWGVR